MAVKGLNLFVSSSYTLENWPPFVEHGWSQKLYHDRRNNNDNKTDDDDEDDDDDDIIIIIDNFCIALFSRVPKLTALYNILQHFLSFTNIIQL